MNFYFEHVIGEIATQNIKPDKEKYMGDVFPGLSNLRQSLMTMRATNANVSKINY